MKEQVKDYIMQDSDGIGVYVGTYKKYDNGNLFGEWIDLEKFSDAEEFLNVCRLLHDDEEEPDLMFQDYQGFPGEFYYELMSKDDIQNILDYVNLSDDDKEMIEDYIECYGRSIEDFKDVLQRAKGRVIGQYDSFLDFAMEQADMMMDEQNVPDWARNYFDYDLFERDMSYDYSCGTNGYVFSDN